MSLAGFVLDSIAFYPGMMSPDSIDQLDQAVQNQYTDWHPPVMAGFWRILNFIYFGPQPMLFFQLGLLWTACFFLTRWLLFNCWPVAALVPILMLMPFIQNFAGTIWKDVQMAAAWFLAAVLLARSVVWQSKLSAFGSAISLLLLLYGCWVRPNGFPGFFPLACLWVIARSGVTPEGSRQWLSLAGKGIFLTAIALLSQVFLSRVVLKAEQNHIEYKLFAHDLAGIYYSTGELHFPEFVTNHPGFDTAYLRKKYSYTTFDNIWWNNDNVNMLPPVDAGKLKIMREYWLASIFKHPRAYLYNRIQGFFYFLRIKDSGSTLMLTYPYTHPNSYGFTYEPGRLAEFIFRNVEKCRSFLVMKPYFWLFLNIVLLPLLYIKQFRQVKLPVLMLLLSSLFYVAFEFIVFPADTEFRYFYWNCISIGLSIILLVSAACARNVTEPSGRQK